MAPSSERRKFKIHDENHIVIIILYLTDFEHTIHLESLLLNRNDYFPLSDQHFDKWKIKKKFLHIYKKTIDDWRKRLSAGMRANGEHFDL